jgi:murein DD-endopeptidase MepM/ murein hydrolase activator NlpD
VPLRVFPVATPPGATYSDDFHAPRADPNGTVRQHLGNDLFAPDGTPVLAPDDGAIRYTVDPIGGPSFYLKADDGTTYYGTHLSAYEGDARRVSAGEVVAYVGHGGNAANTPSHLHFEVHPPGAGAVDPFPFLNQAARQPAPSGGGGGAGGSVLPLLAALGLFGAAGYLYARDRYPRDLSELTSQLRRALR